MRPCWSVCRRTQSGPLTASLLILGAWVALGLVLVGLGALFHRLCRTPVEGAAGWLLCFWRQQDFVGAVQGLPQGYGADLAQGR